MDTTAENFVAAGGGREEADTGEIIRTIGGC